MHSFNKFELTAKKVLLLNAGVTAFSLQWKEKCVVPFIQKAACLAAARHSGPLRLPTVKKLVPTQRVPVESSFIIYSDLKT